MSDSPSISVVIPVYNSVAVVGETIDRTTRFLEEYGWDYEIIVVNDGSRDGSWNVLRDKALANPHIVAINLLRNYGQHTAVFCGLQKSMGSYVVTLDDDLQNPPEEIVHLIEKSREGFDLVFGHFLKKRHPWFRRLGSLLVRAVNRRVFHQPRGLVLSNFRIMKRDVVDRICSCKTQFPYITGLALMSCATPANVKVNHQQRPVGKSGYSLFKILELIARILFNYSAFPLHLVSTVGLVVSGCSFLLGLFYLGKAFFVGVSVPGWTTLVVLLAFHSSIVILILSILGEYVVRLLIQTSYSEIYEIREVIDIHV